MEGEIINRVANSKLKVFDLEDYYPSEPIELIDISQWLHEGFILREKEFRAALSEEDWTKYAGKIIGIHCSMDAIIPTWAMMLVSSYLVPYVAYVFQGGVQEVLHAYYLTKLEHLDYTVYRDLPVIIKGCAKKPVPEQFYVVALAKLTPHAKSVMFGEACSAVPIFKKK